jgi:UDP-N-acetylmuramate dehydrogenase
MIATDLLTELREALPDRVRTDEPLARYTSARIGGPADVFVEVTSADELADVVTRLWHAGTPFIILGGGSNMLVSDRGIRGVVLHNRARQVRFDSAASLPHVWAESGANFGVIARQAAQKGLSGLEWAAGIPGTVGGAVYGNAGAHGGDVAGSIDLAEILHKYQGRVQWTLTELAYAYRSSQLKRNAGDAVVLAAHMRLGHDNPAVIAARMDEFLAHRRTTQPPGATIGSMFKNPPGDHAGRLIEAAGLKGYRVGHAGVSELHANFFVNHGDAAADDVHALIQHAHDAVLAAFNVDLRLEVELVGEWGHI